MRNRFIFCFFFLLASNFLFAQITVSGVLDSTVSMNFKAEDTSAFSFGLEEFANLRFQSKLRDCGTVYGAVNLIAASGDYARNLAGTGVSTAESFAGVTSGENFAAAIELERLYFRLSGEYANFGFGLMRIPFGYGQVWGSSDFLNPKNPLKPDARSRAVLGSVFSWFPSKEEIKLLLFFASGRDAFANEGEGSLAGFSLDGHWDKASLQFLYSYETPKPDSSLGIHRAGLSAKTDIKFGADAGIGLLIDTLYTYNHEAETKLDGLSFSAGADYSFFDGSVIILTEYLYNGENSSTSFNLEENPLGHLNRHYIYASLTFRFNDFTNLNTALVYSYDNVSYTPILILNHELFQGASLVITVQAPFDDDSFYGVYCTARIRLRF